MITMSGKELANSIKDCLKDTIIKEQLSPGLAVITIGDDIASQRYVGMKKRACDEAGIYFEEYKFTEKNDDDIICEKITELNNKDNISGIIVQLPLPSGHDTDLILETILPNKDVDGLTAENLGRLAKNIPGHIPATPLGIVNLLKYYQVPIASQKVLVIGRSTLVGRPIAGLLLNEDATITVAHSKTTDLSKLTKNADIIISAVGVANLITADMVKNGVTIVDVGISVIDGKVVGDVDFDGVSKKASYLTPPIGGVGPMTVAMLLSNAVDSARIQKINK